MIDWPTASELSSISMSAQSSFTVFPDGEARVRVNRSVAGKAVVLTATLDRSDHTGPTDTSRDHDMTDWEAVDRFAKRLAETLPPSQDGDPSTLATTRCSRARTSSAIG